MHTLLVVDDQYGMRLLLKEVFHQEGVSVLTAATGTEALDKLRLKRPDLMLLDLKLPDLDGRTVLQEALCLYPLLRIIIMTADYDEDVAAELLKCSGVLAMLAKPFDVSVVRDLVINYLHTAFDL